MLPLSGELVGHAESSITRLEATVAIAVLTCCSEHGFDVGPAMPAFFSPCSDNCGCEKFVTEFPARPTGKTLSRSNVLYFLHKRCCV